MVDRTTTGLALFVGGVVASFVYAQCRKTRDKLEECTSALSEMKTVICHGRQAYPLTTSTQTNTPETVYDFIHVKYYDSLHTRAFDGKSGESLIDVPCIMLLDDDTVASAFAKLSTGKVTCALIHSGESRELLGVLDRLDIVRYILSPRSHQESVARMLRKCDVASPSISLNDIVMHFRAGRRYMALKQDDERTLLISQESILDHIVCFDGDDELSGILESTVGQLNLGRIAPFCCSCKDTALSAFETMAAYSITSLPIVDASGRAKGVISASDVLLACQGVDLKTSVLEYVEQSRAEFKIDRPANCIVSCDPSFKLENVIRLMLHERIHHVYMLDDQIPTGVISLVDILKIL